MRTITATFTAAAVATAVVAVAGPAQAAAPSQGCPTNWDRLSVQTLSDAGYRVPALVDSPDQQLSFGHAPGNGNGWVCGVALGNRTFAGNQIYNFLDDFLGG